MNLFKNPARRALVLLPLTAASLLLLFQNCETGSKNSFSSSSGGIKNSDTESGGGGNGAGYDGKIFVGLIASGFCADGSPVEMRVAIKAGSALASTAFVLREACRELAPTERKHVAYDSDPIDPSTIRVAGRSLVSADLPLESTTLVYSGVAFNSSSCPAGAASHNSIAELSAQASPPESAKLMFACVNYAFASKNVNGDARLLIRGLAYRDDFTEDDAYHSETTELDVSAMNFGQLDALLRALGRMQEFEVRDGLSTNFASAGHRSKNLLELDFGCRGDESIACGLAFTHVQVARFSDATSTSYAASPLIMERASAVDRWQTKMIGSPSL